MGSNQDYSINMDMKFGYSKIIDLPAIIDSTTDQWFNQTLCQVNECVVRVGIVKGEFHWHTHEKEDEFFFVVEGKLLLDLEGETIDLLPKQGYAVPRGVLHRTRAHERTVILMVEKSTIKPIGDSQNNVHC
ncbi:MAG: cupin domain-containing protein [Candidatus Hodarchaeota archaeon]